MDPLTLLLLDEINKLRKNKPFSQWFRPSVNTIMTTNTYVKIAAGSQTGLEHFNFTTNEWVIPFDGTYRISGQAVLSGFSATVAQTYYARLGVNYTESGNIDATTPFRTYKTQANAIDTLEFDYTAEFKKGDRICYLVHTSTAGNLGMVRSGWGGFSLQLISAKD